MKKRKTKPSWLKTGVWIINNVETFEEINGINPYFLTRKIKTVIVNFKNGTQRIFDRKPEPEYQFIERKG